MNHCAQFRYCFILEAHLGYQSLSLSDIISPHTNSIRTFNKAGEMAQTVELLMSKCEDLSLNPLSSSRKVRCDCACAGDGETRDLC